MRYIYFAALLLITFKSSSQEHGGIKFEQSLSWAEAKEKAKKENKYIFLDGYTTWCGPCREMAKNIFPLQEVGTFFNDNFINLAVQFDVTNHDNNFVKAWYEDAKILHETYKISAYPTYLFFNPDGNLVHYFKGSSKSAGDFISKAKLALNPKSQYMNLKLEYELGKRDSVFLLELIRTASDSQDMAADTFINEYLSTQKNKLTRQNLDFISRATSKSTDPGFDIVKNYPAILDSVAGNGKSKEILKTIAFDEIVLPIFNRKKTKYGGGMVMYSGELNQNVNWDEVKKRLDLVYPALSAQVILTSKPLYYQMLGDWTKFCSSVSLYMADTLIFDKDQLQSYANIVRVFSDDQESFKKAAKWSEKLLLLQDKTRPWYLRTYSELLYKSGQHELAIKPMRDYLKLAPSDEYAIEELKKMNKGENLR